MRLLVLASRSSDRVEMAELAQALARRRHRVTFLYLHSELTADGSTMSSATPLDPSGGLLVERAVDVDSLCNAPVRRTAGDWLRELRRLRRTVPRLVRSGRAIAMRRAIVMLGQYERVLHLLRDIFRRDAFDAMLMPEDVVGRIWPVAVKAAHEHGVPALVFPYTLANQQEPFQSLKDTPDYHTRHNTLAARLFPRWRLRQGDTDLVRLPAAHVFVHEALEISPPDPWLMNSGYADKICVDSAASFDYFRASGIPAGQMEVVGSVSQDVMFELRRNRAAHLAALRRELKLAGDKPLLLVSGCPNQLTGPVPHSDFRRFDDIAAFIGRTLAALGDDYHLVVRPHPKYPEFGPMLEQYGLVTARQPTSHLVPLADLFVAFASATIRWAIACAVPAINYDIFHFGYGDFASAQGVVSTTDRSVFAQTVEALRPGSARYAELGALIRADSERWSRMDGSGTSRIEDAIRRASAARRAASAAVPA